MTIDEKRARMMWEAAGGRIVGPRTEQWIIPSEAMPKFIDAIRRNETDHPSLYDVIDAMKAEDAEPKHPRSEASPERKNDV